MVDWKDLKIIEMLRNNARTPFTKIAEELGVTESTIRKRVKALEKSGAIIGYTINVDPVKLGYKNIALIGIDTAPENYFEVVEKLISEEEVRSVSTSSGDHMIMIEYWAKNNKELMEFTNKLNSLKGVTKVCPAIILEKLK